MYRYCDARLNMISDYRKVIFLMLQSVSVFAHLFFFFMHDWDIVQILAKALR